MKTFINEHMCQVVRNNSLASYVWMARVLKDALRAEPNMSLQAMRTVLQDKYGVTDFGNHKLFRARLRAKGGDLLKHGEEFTKLKWYAIMVLKTNPGSNVVVASDCLHRERVPRDVPKFKRIFFCLAASKDGFLTGCRPFFGLDGTHLKGPYGGILLSAVALDANEKMFPLAIAIVEIENTESWRWFLMLLRDALGVDFESRRSVVISDRQKV